MTKYNKSAICKTANTLRKQGLTASESFRKAWELAKNIITKVTGVTFGKRPAALARLTRYAKEQIGVKLVRDCGNSFDRSAIAVMAVVEGKGSYQVGYLSSDLSKSLSAVMDMGRKSHQFSKIAVLSSFCDRNR
jgi:HIRAN domain.